MENLPVFHQTNDLHVPTDDLYYKAMATWLQGKSKNTQLSYLRAMRQLLAFTQKHPKTIQAIDIAGWKEALKQDGKSDATIDQSLSAVSSYYIYLQRPQPEGPPLHTYNPVQGVDRHDLEIDRYDRARKLSLSDFQKLVAQIDTSKPNGARDFAMFLFYVLCARRRSEVVQLHGRDIRADERRMSYRVRLKGGKTRWKELPPPVWEAIADYLAISGRSLAENEPVFVATVQNGKYLQQFYGREEREALRPITGQAINQALHRYAKKAGLDPKSVSLHSLRHLGAELFQKASNDIAQTQQFLDHAQLNTTQIYLKQLSGETHRHWQAMTNDLELDA